MSEPVMSTDLLRLPASALGAIHRALARDHAPPEAATLVREIGLESGEGFFETLRDWMSRAGAGAVDPAGLPAEEFWSRLSHFFAQLGWGTLEYERLHPAVVSLSSNDWAEARGTAAGTQPSCHLTTGLLADLLRRVADGELAAMEVECGARRQGRCRFLIGNPEALNRVYDRMREGSDLHAALGALG